MTLNPLWQVHNDLLAEGKMSISNPHDKNINATDDEILDWLNIELDFTDAGELAEIEMIERAIKILQDRK